MFAVRHLNALAAWTLRIIGSLAGWVFLAPLALLIPRRRDLVVVIGRQDGRFLDNAKYFFLQGSSLTPGIQFVFLSERTDVVDAVRSFGLCALQYPAFDSAWALLRSGVAVVDESNWFRRGRRFLLVGTPVIQLWHGVGFKLIERSRWRAEVGENAWASKPLVSWFRLALYRFIGRWHRYAAIGTTSAFYRDEVFRPAFCAKRFPITGYPRNDFAQSLTTERLALAWSNVDQRIKRNLKGWQTAGRQLVLVTPTFRDTGGTPMQLDSEILSAIDAFAEHAKVEFIFKFHPAEKNTNEVIGKHFHVCKTDSDIYPLFPYLSALVTDYSSISMDFLLVDMPLLFLIPVGDDYTTRDRQLQFDPYGMMPGPIVPTWQALLKALAAQWENDEFAAERAALRTKAFDDLPQADAAPKLLDLMMAEGWLRPEKRSQPQQRL